jgi:predicted membrane protein
MEAYARTRLGKLGIALAIDNFVLWPLLIYPLYYPTYALCMHWSVGPSPEQAAHSSTDDQSLSCSAVASDSLRTYFKKDFVEVNLTSMAFWVPTNSVNFLSVAPAWRSTYMSCCAFVWGVGWSLQQQLLRMRHSPGQAPVLQVSQ